jgi:hypothetical protein
MGHGGKREGAGRKPKIASAAAADGRTNAARIWATRLIAGLTDPGSLDPKLTPAEVIEIEEWRPLWEALDLRIRLDTRKYLYDKRDGKPVQPHAGAEGGPIQHEHYVFEPDGGVRRGHK